MLTNELSSNAKFTELVPLAKSKNCAVILVHPNGVLFPGDTLDPVVQRVLNSIAIPYIQDSKEYSEMAWKIIYDNFLNRKVFSI